MNPVLHNPFFKIMLNKETTTTKFFMRQTDIKIDKDISAVFRKQKSGNLLPNYSQCPGVIHINKLFSSSGLNIFPGVSSNKQHCSF